MNPDDKKAEVIQWLSELSIKEFVELFYAAADKVGVWNYEDDEESERFADSEEHLALVFVDIDKREYRTIHWLQFIGLPDAEEGARNYSKDVNLIEQGKCECGNQVKSWAKRAICPVCRRKVRLT